MVRVIFLGQALRDLLKLPTLAQEYLPFLRVISRWDSGPQRTWLSGIALTYSAVSAFLDANTFAFSRSKACEGTHRTLEVSLVS